MNTPPGSPGRAGASTKSPLEARPSAPKSPLLSQGAQTLFQEMSGEDSDASSESEQLYPLQREEPRTEQMKDVQKMHIPSLGFGGMKHSASTESLGDTAFLPMETPTMWDIDQLFERTDRPTNLEFSHVQIVEEAHVVEPETREACKEIEYFLKRRDQYVFRKPTRYWGGLDRSKMRARNKGPLGRWRHEPKVCGNAAAPAACSAMFLAITCCVFDACTFSSNRSQALSLVKLSAHSGSKTASRT
mgnify:CR=1 FL=1